MRNFSFTRSRARQLVLGALAFVPALLVAAVLTVALSKPAVAQEPPGQGQTFTTITLINESKSTAFPATSWYTSSAGGGVFGFYRTADVFLAATSVSGTVYMTATPQYSADGVLWSNADERVYSGTTASNVAFSLSLAPTGDAADHLRMPLIGQYFRVLLAVSGDVDPAVKVTIRQ